ncbi:bile acid-CoA:amino acid N-acyltransferase-like isoform X1 [Hyalella azteca]|uniref:Bile acid-CoA:amino acid N-acyltransferase-like isoform X1 n=1 Tax=Hyalella azteca TaxID=294128 RepID=A0A979FVD6_HYAAZ|nr:bile acid-CoA:amino acid N-acyltransferase-like isoform X1 [Hyalella azteca]
MDIASRLIGHGLKILHPRLCAPIRVNFKEFSVSCSRDAANIEVMPRISLMDVPTSIRVTDLTPFALVTLQMRVEDSRGLKFTSHAHYACNERGAVDVSSSPSLGGSFRGIFPEGLISTLDHGPEYQFKRPNVKTDQPWKIVIGAYEGHLRSENCTRPLCEVDMERHFRGPGVKRIELEGQLKGALYLPAGPGPHPAVVDMFGGSILLAEHRSSLLASRGIASLILSHMSVFPSLSFDFEHLEHAVNFLLSQPNVIPDRCGVVANCMAGAYGCLMGIHIDRVKAVYLLNAPAVANFFNIQKNGHLLVSGFAVGSQHLVFDENFVAEAHPEYIKQAFYSDQRSWIPIELTPRDTYYSINAGADDSFVAVISQNILKSRLDKVGNENYVTKVYEGSGHIIEPPYFPFLRVLFQTPWPNCGENHKGPEPNKLYLRCGGNPRDNAINQEKAWQDMRNFLTRHVRDNSPWYQTYIRDNSCTD